MATIKITNIDIKIAKIERLWSELSDKETAALSGGMCRGGGYPIYDLDLGHKACPDYVEGDFLITPGI